MYAMTSQDCLRWAYAFAKFRMRRGAMHWLNMAMVHAMAEGHTPRAMAIARAYAVVKMIPGI